MATDDAVCSDHASEVAIGLLDGGFDSLAAGDEFESAAEWVR